MDAPNANIPALKDVDQREPVFPNAKQVKKDDILGKKITIKAFKQIDSTMNQSGKATVILAELEGQEISFMSATAIDSVLDRTKDKMPYTATLVEKKGKKSGKNYFALE